MTVTTDHAVPTLHAVISAHAASRGDAPAIRKGARLMTYSQLNTLANRLAQSMMQYPIPAGCHVVFLGRNSDAVPVFALGAMKAGVVPVPLNWRLAGPEMAHIISDCAAQLVFVEPEFADLADAIVADGPHRPLIIPARVLLDDGSWLSENLGEVDQARDSETIALQIYTSGSTGRPKGVMLSHRALLGINTLRPQLSWDGWSSDDITLVQAPLGHIGAFGMMVRTLFFGGQAIIHDSFEAGATLQAISQNKVTKLSLVPTAVKMLLDHPAAKTTDYSSLESIVYGSAPIATSLLREAIATMGCNFIQSYGMTETSGPTVALPPQDHDPAGNMRMTGAGKPLPATEISIRDPEGLRVAIEQTGEIWIKSIANMSGYWNMPEETAQTLTADGWVRTGDAGYLDSDGFLFVRGRIRETINTGGEKVYPAEVENALVTCPDIAEVSVAGVADPLWGQAVHAFVVPAEGASPSAETIRSWGRDRIAAYKLPKIVHFIAALPHNATGKVDKQALIRLAQGC